MNDILMTFKLKYKPFGKRSILIEWPNKIDEKILRDIILFKSHIAKAYIKVIVDVNHGYNSLLIVYRYDIDNFYDKFSDLKSLYLSRTEQVESLNRIWTIPVCYDTKFGIDLEEFSRQKELTINKIIDLHSNTRYLVYFSGFLPGFCYLGGLKKPLHISRKSSPNINIKKGSVGIGGAQTGIYQQDSPGGWYILGNTPVEFFNPRFNNPSFISPGDYVQFKSVDLMEYEDIKRAVENGSYTIKNELING